jgi:hypothetical protein
MERNVPNGMTSLSRALQLYQDRSRAVGEIPQYYEPVRRPIGEKLERGQQCVVGGRAQVPSTGAPLNDYA